LPEYLLPVPTTKESQDVVDPYRVIESLIRHRENLVSDSNALANTLPEDHAG
jgi:hypothetical protein